MHLCRCHHCFVKCKCLQSYFKILSFYCRRNATGAAAGRQNTNTNTNTNTDPAVAQANIQVQTMNTGLSQVRQSFFYLTIHNWVNRVKMLIFFIHLDKVGIGKRVKSFDVPGHS